MKDKERVAISPKKEGTQKSFTFGRAWKEELATITAGRGKTTKILMNYERPNVGYRGAV